MAALQALLDLVTDFNYSIDREGKLFSNALSYNYVLYIFVLPHNNYVFSFSFPVDFRFVLLFLENYNMFMVYNHLKTFINPRRACAARVTVVVLCVCPSVCLSVCLSATILGLQATRRLMSDTNSFSATRA